MVKTKTLLTPETEFTMKSVYENMTAELVDSDWNLACFFQERARRIEAKYFNTNTNTSQGEIYVSYAN